MSWIAWLHPLFSRWIQWIKERGREIIYSGTPKECGGDHVVGGWVCGYDSRCFPIHACLTCSSIIKQLSKSEANIFVQIEIVRETKIPDNENAKPTWVASGQLPDVYLNQQHSLCYTIIFSVLMLGLRLLTCKCVLHYNITKAKTNKERK